MRLHHLILSTAVASTLLIACSEPCPPPAEHFEHAVFSIPLEADANIAVVERYLNALIAADATGIRGAVGDGFYANNTWVPADSSDVEGVIANWMQNDSTRTDQKVTKVFAQSIQIADGNEYPGQWVQYWGSYSATDKATGKSYVVQFLLDGQVKEGKLVKTYTHYDRLSVYQQLGVAPPAATEAKK